MLSVTSDDGLLTSIEDSFSSFINLKSFLYFRFLVIRIAEDISSLFHLCQLVYLKQDL